MRLSFLVNYKITPTLRIFTGRHRYALKSRSTLFLFDITSNKRTSSHLVAFEFQIHPRVLKNSTNLKGHNYRVFVYKADL